MGVELVLASRKPKHLKVVMTHNLFQVLKLERPTPTCAISPTPHTISTLRTILGQFDSYQDEEVPVHVADADADADADETASS